jgi:hypothetical protein
MWAGFQETIDVFECFNMLCCFFSSFLLFFLAWSVASQSTGLTQVLSLATLDLPCLPRIFNLTYY